MLEHMQIFWGYFYFVKDIKEKFIKRLSNKRLLNFLKQSLINRYMLRTHELSNRKRNVLYLTIRNKFPLNQFSWLSFKFQVKQVISVKVSLIIEEITFKHVELNNFELILLQTDAGVSKWGIFITKWCQHQYKVGHLCAVTKLNR